MVRVCAPGDFAVNTNQNQDLTRIRLPAVAALAGVSETVLKKHIYSRRSPCLSGLPEPVASSRGGGNRLVWIKQDIIDWLMSQRTYQPALAPFASDPATARRAGRPRKLEGGAA